MNKICNSCGAHHKCVIGNYYQPTCDCTEKKTNKELTDFIYGDGRLDVNVIFPTTDTWQLEANKYGVIATAKLLPMTRTNLGAAFISIQSESTNKTYALDVYSTKRNIPTSTLGYFTVKAGTCTKMNDLCVYNQGFEDAYIVIKDRIEI